MPSNHTPNIQNNFLNLKNQYWSTQRKTTFHNYLKNWGVKEIFQIKSYPKCTLHFNKIFYEWSVNNPSILTKLDKEQMSLEAIHFLQYDSLSRELSFNNDEKTCLDFGFFSPKEKKRKPNYPLIKKYICYFTMNNTNVLDNLALDFVNSTIKQTFSRKNTVICGDYDKYYKWVSIFNPILLRSTGLIEFYPYSLPIQTINLINSTDEEIEDKIKYNAGEINIVRSVHKHFLVGGYYEALNKLAKYVNCIDFPYGGEFYNLDPLSDIDKLEIVKLLLVHGWHLLNNIQPQQKPKTKSPTENLLYKHLKNTDDTRIPLNVLHKIYNHFIDSQKTDTELQKELVAKGFSYETKAIRAQDKTYLQTLSKEAGKHYCELEIRETPKQKAISCKLNPEFWNEISPERKKETEDKNAAEFNEYLKELAEKYAPFFIEEAPEDPTIDNPLAGFVSPEKIKDEDLQ